MRCAFVCDSCAAHADNLQRLDLDRSLRSVVHFWQKASPAK
jgi:hypothetical protein